MSLIYLFLTDRKSIIIYFFIIAIIILNPFKSYKLVTIEEIDNNYAIGRNIFYSCKINNYDKLRIGDYIYLKSNLNDINDISLNKKNLKYEYNDDYQLIFNNNLKYNIHKIIDSLDNEQAKNILLNKYEDNIFLGYGFGLYYLIKKICNKNKIIGNTLLFLYIFAFCFNIKFYFLIFDLLFRNIKINNKDKFSLYLLCLIIINKYLLLNKSIYITLIFKLLYLTKYNRSKIIYAFIQSIFFYKINIFSLFFYQIYIYLRILLFSSSVLYLIFQNNLIFNIIINIINLFYKITSLEIKGQISIFGIIIYLIFKKILKIYKEPYSIILLIIISITNLNNPTLHVNFIDVGQGDSILIHGNFGLHNTLIDTGSTYNYSKLKDALYKEGIYKIDNLIITHSDNDHSGNIKNLNKDFKINKIIYKGEDIKYEDYNLKYLMLPELNNNNDNSLVYLLNIKNNQILFTADISKRAEKLLINKYNINNIDILKVGHHGSKTSTSIAMLEKTLPKISIISTNGQYNHPHSETIKTLDKFKIKTYITKYSGNIVVYYTNIFDFIKTDNREFAIIK